MFGIHVVFSLFYLYLIYYLLYLVIYIWCNYIIGDERTRESVRERERDGTISLYIITILCTFNCKIIQSVFKSYSGLYLNYEKTSFPLPPSSCGKTSTSNVSGLNQNTCDSRCFFILSFI